MNCCNYIVHNTAMMYFNELQASKSCWDGNNYHYMKHHNSQFQMDPKTKNQMQWDVATTMCTTPLRWTFNELWTLGLRQDGNRGHWMKTLKPQHDQEKKLQSIMKNLTNTCIFIIDHEKKLMHGKSRVKMISGITNGGDWQCLTTSKAPKSKVHACIAQLHNFNSQPPKELPSSWCIFNSYLQNLAKSQRAMVNGKKEQRSARLEVANSTQSKKA